MTLPAVSIDGLLAREREIIKDRNKRKQIGCFQNKKKKTKKKKRLKEVIKWEKSFKFYPSRSHPLLLPLFPPHLYPLLAQIGALSSPI